MIIDFIADLITPLAAILLHLLAVFDTLGPIGCDIATRIRAARNTIRAILRSASAIFRSTCGRTILAGRTLPSGTSVLQERGRRASSRPGANCRGNIRTA
jgi:hypothetical protein